jgi:hypothetical protein
VLCLSGTLGSVGPVAVIDELQNRAAEKTRLEPPVGEYWEPTGIWHLLEILAHCKGLLEEVRVAAERDVDIRRWVQYNQDRERARSL